MKRKYGKLAEAELKARRRFWNGKGFFGEPAKKETGRDPMKMQRLVGALETLSGNGVAHIRRTIYPGGYFTGAVYAVRRASESDSNHAVSALKIL